MNHPPYKPALADIAQRIVAPSPTGRREGATPISGRRLLRAFSLSLGALLLAGMATSARADPCEGRLPSQPGQQFTGTVRYVGDGDSLCVGISNDPSTWIEVRLADFDAPELNAPDGRLSKSLLERVASGQSVACEARRGRSGRVIVFDRVIAVCRVRGRSIGDLLRARNAPEGGN